MKFKFAFVALALAAGSIVVPGVASAATTYKYVSPAGNDSNDGSQATPWKSLRKAAQSAVAGNTIIFEDGTYTETVTARMTSGGTVDSPIVFKSRNPHGAKIVFSGIPNTRRFQITYPYVTVQDFDFDGGGYNVATATTSDSLLTFSDGATNSSAINNVLHGVYEDGLKVSHTSYFTALNNDIYNIEHEGIDAVNIYNSVIKSNYVHGALRNGIMVKGGSRNVDVNGNSVRVPSVSSFNAYTLGGVTGASSTYDTAGYEGYNLVFHNNIAFSYYTSVKAVGFAFIGCKNCVAANNSLANIYYPFQLRNGGDGTTWVAVNLNPDMRNNVIKTCAGTGLQILNTPNSYVSKYNLFESCAAPAVNSNPLAVPANFVNPTADWHLMAGSGAANTGLCLLYWGYYTDANTPAISPIRLDNDRADATRVAPCDAGAYIY